jgi:DNA-binding CsgD family transcriptional regulator
VQLFGMSPSGDTLHFKYSAGAAMPQASFDFLRKYRRLSPHIKALVAMPVGAWFHDHLALSEAFMASDPYYQEFLIPYGGRWVSMTKLSADPQEMVGMGVQRAVGQKPLGPEEIAVLDRLRVHLVRALGMQQRLSEVRRGSSALGEMLDKFRHPMLMVGPDRAIRARNRAAQQFLESGDFLRDRHGHLVSATPEGDAALGRAIDSLALLDDGAAARATPARDCALLRLKSARSGDSQLVFVIAVRQQSDIAVLGPLGAAMVICHDLNARTWRDPFVVAEVWGLTPAEARVLVKLADGKAVEAIADEHEVAVATVRTQVKALFSKMGAKRQADLVRMVNTLPDMIPLPADGPGGSGHSPHHPEYEAPVEGS